MNHYRVTRAGLLCYGNSLLTRRLGCGVESKEQKVVARLDSGLRPKYRIERKSHELKDFLPPFDDVSRFMKI